MSRTLGSAIKGEVLGLVKTGGMLLGGLAVLALVAAFFPHPVEVFFRLLSIAGIAMLILSIATMVLTFRKAKAIEPVALLLSLAVSVVGTLISLWFGGRPPAALLSLAAVLAGVLIGIAWSLTTLLFVDNAQIRGRGTIWYLVIWGITFALNQIVAIVFGHAPSAMTLLMLSGAGLTVGNTLGLVVRVRRAEKFVLTKSEKFVLTKSMSSASAPSPARPGG